MAQKAQSAKAAAARKAAANKSASSENSSSTAGHEKSSSTEQPIDPLENHGTPGSHSTTSNGTLSDVGQSVRAHSGSMKAYV